MEINQNDEGKKNPDGGSQTHKHAHKNQPTYCRVVTNRFKVNLYTFSVAYTLQTNTVPYIYIYNFI